MTDEEFAAFDNHNRASDYAETSATWLAMGREAGFERVDELLVVPNQLARVYRYSHKPLSLCNTQPTAKGG